jgi:hypothetical protein
MYMNKKIIFGIIILIAVIAVVYILNDKESDSIPTTNQTPVTSGENPLPGSTVHDLPAEPAAVKARLDLAAKLGIPEKTIVILLVENKTWNDGCLGLGGPAESCLTALVEGFRVELLAQGKTYVYRTDKAGAALRAETN